MMDLSEVRRIVDEHLPFMLWDLQVNMWDVRISYEPFRAEVEEGVAGQNSYDTDYDHCHIQIDPSRADTEEDVLRTLRHELLHLITSPIVDPEEHIRPFLTKEQQEALRTMLRHAEERIVLNIERMLDGGYRLPLGRRPDYNPQMVNPYDVDTISSDAAEGPAR